jgi:hypothetical protein
LKAPLSKSGSPERRRGFESHPLRQFSSMFSGVGFLVSRYLAGIYRFMCPDQYLS